MLNLIDDIILKYALALLNVGEYGGKNVVYAYLGEKAEEKGEGKSKPYYQSPLILEYRNIFLH